MIFKENTKPFGFGLMRLAQRDGTINIEQLKQMVDYFIQAGFTYFDTAWSYKGSEIAIRQALIDRYPRESYQIATKLPQIFNANKEDTIKPFYDSLERLNVQYFDNYLFHNLGKDRTKFCDKYDLWSFVNQQKEKGKIKHIGCSFHSTPQELKDILKNHPEIEFVQLQINYADWNNPTVQSKQNYEVARSFNKSIIIMEPLKGGQLANPPQKVKEFLDSTNYTMSCVDWCFGFAASLPGVEMVLSGMRNLSEVITNTFYFNNNFKIFNQDQLNIINKAQQILKEYPLINCTACNYCNNVCPMNIGIAETLYAKNNYLLYNNIYAAKNREFNLIHFNNKEFATKCIKCGQCEKICPQQIQIRKELQESISLLHS